MKKTLFIIGGLILLVGSATAQEPSEDAVWRIFCLQTATVLANSQIGGPTSGKTMMDEIVTRTMRGVSREYGIPPIDLRTGKISLRLLDLVLEMMHDTRQIDHARSIEDIQRYCQSQYAP